MSRVAANENVLDEPYIDASDLIESELDVIDDDATGDDAPTDPYEEIIVLDLRVLAARDAAFC